MEGVSEEDDLDAISKEITSLNGVESIHDIHIWNVSEDTRVFTCHIVSPCPLEALKRVKELLNFKYRIFHVTIQVEPTGSANPKNLSYNCENDIHD